MTSKRFSEEDALDILRQINLGLALGSTIDLDLASGSTVETAIHTSPDEQPASYP